MCGIACSACENLAATGLVYEMLNVLQNRGDQTAGLALSGGCQPHDLVLAKGVGTPIQVFPYHLHELLRGHCSIGHVRYATSGGANPAGAQPFRYGDITLCHNGNVTNVDELRKLLPRGIKLGIGNDSEVIAALIGLSHGSLHDRIVGTAEKLKGSFTLMILQSGGTLAIVRDPLGNRPAETGRIEFDGDSYGLMAASETTAIEKLGGVVGDEVSPGEIMYVYPDMQVERIRYSESSRRAFCIFEFIYFARPTSRFFGISCYDFRKALGARLLREIGLKYDPEAIVTPVLNSGLGGSLGLAHEGGLRYEPLLINTGLAKRTFMGAMQQLRQAGVQDKHFPVATCQGKRYLLVDDSIVRGTTAGPVIESLRRNDPSSIELMIPCPMFRHPCSWGIDTPTEEELIANRLNGDVDAICAELGADALHYLSVEGLNQVITDFGLNPADFCQACFTGDVPF